MASTFASASSFNGDLSKWDVSRVTNMEEMFSGASSFAQTLCGAWQTSTADKKEMFTRSSGRICTTSTTTSVTTSMTTSTRWSPKSKAELRAAIEQCLQLST